MQIQGILMLYVGKSKKGNKYYAICVEMGYARKMLYFDVNGIAEILGVAVKDIYELDYGDYRLS